MLASKLYSPTLREIPADAEIASHQYMLKAGMIRKNGGGLYSFLPLGRRVELKIEAIVREEMENIGAQEIMMPIMQPAEIWHESGRWNAYGPEMFKLEDRHGNHFCLGPTHEELITTLVRNELRSYKQMPVTLWQMQNKYRDEIRPRFGLMRSREFVMKDAYSFDVDEEGLHKSYQDEYEAYTRIFTRCGLNFKPKSYRARNATMQPISKRPSPRPWKCRQKTQKMWNSSKRRTARPLKTWPSSCTSP